MDIKSICVYCGSSPGKRAVFVAAAEALDVNWRSARSRSFMAAGIEG
jgi:hypothetical protein